MIPDNERFTQPNDSHAKTAIRSAAWVCLLGLGLFFASVLISKCIF